MKREFDRTKLDKFFEGELRHAYEGKYKTAAIILMDPEETTEKYADITLGYTGCGTADLTNAISMLEKARLRIWLAEMADGEE